MNIQNFEKQLTLNYSAKKTVEAYINQVKPFIRFCEDNITQEKLENYLLSRRENVSTASYNIFLNAINKYCELSNIKLKIPKQKAVKRKVKPYWTVEEFEGEILPYFTIIFSDYEEKDLMINMMFFVGLRPKEICDFKFEDIDYKKEIFIVRQGKGAKDRIIPFLDNKLIKKLQQYGENKTGKIFNINYTRLRNIFCKIKQELSLDYEVTPKITRKSFAKYCLRRGMDSLYLKQLLGHEDIKTTEIYAEPDEKMLLEACQKIRR